MEDRVMKIIWHVSLLIIEVSTIMIAGNSIINKITGRSMPDICIRGLGIFLMIALAVFAFSTVKRFL